MSPQWRIDRRYPDRGRRLIEILGAAYGWPDPIGERLCTYRDAFIQALVAMGAEKNADAMASIEKALASEPGNKEYLATRDLIKKSMGMKKK